MIVSKLEAKDLSITYGKRKILDEISFNVKSDEVVGLLGPNGAGKTTSFYMIAGLVKPDNGSVWLDKTEISSLPIHARAKLGIGYLPQEASVFRKLTVYENIYSILELRGELNEQEKQDQCLNLLQEFQIEHIQESDGISLSGGERRRVEIARALAAEPKFILLDEPFAGVDPISVIEIQKIIHQLIERKIGVLITDHNVRETLGICNRAYILSNGKIIAEGGSKTILENKQVRDVYLGKDFTL
jgi:lipopolysaccharide export system ATP-binding protein